MKQLLLATSLFCCLFISCEEDGNNPRTNTTKNPNVTVPKFNADSAYAFIEKQVAFGPRVPNTAEHDSCAAWLESKLGHYGLDMVIQEGEVKAYDGTLLNAINIIGSFNPEQNKRIFLCAHWDTRPWADQDVKDIKKPIDGANDGASGVGILLEIARILTQHNVTIGVDIILFDAEDYGVPRFAMKDVPHSYCLGSQLWAEEPHRPNYRANYGILLDMVGSANAKFTMEGTSMKYAPETMNKVWQQAHKNGFGQYFSFDKTPPITDDHLYINELAGIPCIDIIHFDSNTPSRFGSYWHTHNDNIDVIDKATLHAVGQTLLHVIFKEDRGTL